MKYRIFLALSIATASPLAALGQEAKGLSILPADHGNKVLISKDTFPSVAVCEKAVADMAKEQSADPDSKGVVYLCVPADLSSAESSYPVTRVE